jgi:hypothetical protein
MNCCDATGKCHQGENCAIRAAADQPIRVHTKRRYRAGQPAEIPMPTLPIDVAEPDEDRITAVDLVMGGACIVICLFVVAVTFNMLGWI